MGKGRPAAGKAHPGNIAEGGAPADDGDVAVPAVQQHLHRADRSRIVIGGHAGQVLKAQLLGRGGDQHRRHGDAGKIAPEIISVAAQKQQALRLFFGTQLYRPQHFVGVLVKEIDDQRVGTVFHQPLQLLHQRGKQLVVGALYQHQYAAAHRLLQILGVGIQNEAGLFHHRQDALPRLFADVRVVIQHAGNGAYRIAGFPGNILDGHGIIP